VLTGINLLAFSLGVLLEYNSAPAESRNYQKKDGALVAIAVLAKVPFDLKASTGCVSGLSMIPI
jgi:hypothetical protein